MNRYALIIMASIEGAILMKPEKEIKMRPYQSEDDYWRIREFLRQVFLLNDCKELSWHVARLDYWHWHGVKNLEVFPAIDEVMFIWETQNGQMVEGLRRLTRLGGKLTFVGGYSQAAKGPIEPLAMRCPC